ncbi:MAG: hypothetical protein IJ600_02105 [Lachnospiraceae bacterium]|nr:hypothetical protein [Lachnospiraceae bacterium]
MGKRVTAVFLYCYLGIGAKSGPFLLPIFKAVSGYFHKKRYKMLLTIGNGCDGSGNRNVFSISAERWGIDVILGDPILLKENL